MNMIRYDGAVAVVHAPGTVCNSVESANTQILTMHTMPAFGYFDPS